jgi:hypothetical protein
MNPNSYKSLVARSASRFSNFGGNGMAPANRLQQLNRTFTVLITNATNADATYVVFGNNIYGDAASAGSSTGVTVTISESSHAQVKRETANSPVQLVMAKYKTSDADNLSNTITYYEKDSTGKVQSIPVTPLNYQEPENNQSLLVRINDFEGMDIYGGSYLTGTIKTNTTITLILSVGTKVDLRNAASDDSVIVTTSRPAPNGQAPLQLQVSAPVAMPAAVATPDVATKSKFLGF